MNENNQVRYANFPNATADAEFEMVFDPVSEDGEVRVWHQYRSEIYLMQSLFWVFIKTRAEGVFEHG